MAPGWHGGGGVNGWDGGYKTNCVPTVDCRAESYYYRYTLVDKHKSEWLKERVAVNW
jgi:hypothetical protein